LDDWTIGRLDDWAIGRLGDWAIGRLGDWAIGRFSMFDGMGDLSLFQILYIGYLSFRFMVILTDALLACDFTAYTKSPINLLIFMIQ